VQGCHLRVAVMSKMSKAQPHCYAREHDDHHAQHSASEVVKDPARMHVLQMMPQVRI
jgi:hypothetical protein